MPPQQPPSTKKPWYKKWWIWTIVAIVVIVGAFANLGNKDKVEGTADIASQSAAAEQSVPAPAADEPQSYGVATDQVGQLLSIAEANLELEGFTVESVSDNGKAILDKGNWTVIQQAQNEGAVLLTVAKPETEASAETLEQPSSQAEQNQAPAAEAESAMTMGQRQAVAMGRQYLEYTAFSRSGLIEQLEYEGFSNEDSTFAVDTIAPDWNDQAAKMATQYLDYTSFSRDGLIEQLVFEGFSYEEAEYGVTQAGY